METIKKKFKPARFVMFIIVSGILLVSGCARYSRNVNTLYEPSAAIRGGSGEVYIVIPENQQTRSPDIKWVLGKVKDDDNNNIDEISSPSSPSEIIQGAFGQEFRKAGYTVILTNKNPGGEKRVINLTKTEIELEQISDFADLKATCRALVGIDVFKDGQLIKRFQYVAASSRTDINDRDMLARYVLEEAVQSVMLKAMPELHSLFIQ